ncbi:MAG: peptide chain release factor N(5)-glutamine methyltransferase [Phycisphaeraceae bacterium]|nr:peptide chain release factor N(5)-glutamine methyltransferase [Phycisphaeraceae bacterium]
MSDRPGTAQQEDWNTKRLLNWITEAFQKKGLESPRMRAEMLVAHVLGCQRLELYTRYERPASPLERQSLRDLVGRALKDEPIDYLIGERWFFGLPFHVSRAVLVPRPSTETIVEQVLLHCRASHGGSPGSRGRTGEGIRFADIGTGSGCITVALLKNLPKATAIATDLSADALEIARKNAVRHSVADRVEFIQGDLLAPLVEHPAGRGGGAPFDYLLSNPPYIPDPEWAEVPPDVKHYEPESALRGGADGLRFLRPLLNDGPGLLRPGGEGQAGVLMLETAASTAERLKLMARAHPDLDPETCRVVDDGDGLPRVVVAARR